MVEFIDKNRRHAEYRLQAREYKKTLHDTLNRYKDINKEKTVCVQFDYFALNKRLKRLKRVKDSKHFPTIAIKSRFHSNEPGTRRDDSSALIEFTCL